MRTHLPALLYRCGLPTALAGLTLYLCHIAPVSDKMSEPGIDLDLPVFVGDFMGVSLEISEGERVILPPDTGIARRHYSTLDGRQVITSIVLAGSDARSIHRPEICLPAQGWKIKGARTFTVPLGNERSPTEMTLLTLAQPVQLRDGRTVERLALYAYYFIGENKTTAHHWERIFLSSYDRLFHGQNHRWAYVAFLVPVPIQLDTGLPVVEPAMDSLQAFLRDSGNTFLPRPAPPAKR